VDDEKPAIIAEPPPDPAVFKCWFCRKSHQQVQTLLGAEYPVRDPHDFAHETLIFICNECVTKFAESLARRARRLHGHRRSPAEIGLGRQNSLVPAASGTQTSPTGGRKPLCPGSSRSC
jgi:hypothetical protein